jgi:hypothetical protein
VSSPYEFFSQFEDNLPLHGLRRAFVDILSYPDEEEKANLEIIAEANALINNP